MPNESEPVSADIFRFVSMRGVNTPPATARDRRFIFWNLPRTYAELQALMPAGVVLKAPLLLVELADSAQADTREAVINQIVRDKKATSSLRITEKEFSKFLPAQLLEAYVWHRDANRRRTLQRKAFSDWFDAALGADAATLNDDAQFAHRKLALWESLVAEYFTASGTSGEHLSRLVDMVRIFWILEKLRSGTGLQNGQDIHEAMHATVVLPDDAIPSGAVPPNEPTTREMPESPEKPNREADQRRLNELDRAEKEVSSAYRNQLAEEKHSSRETATGSRNVGKPDAGKRDFLGGRYAESLSAATKSTLRGIGFERLTEINVPLLLAQIENERSKISGRDQGEHAMPMATNINGRFTQFDNLCYHYTPPDPCAPYNKNGARLPVGCGLIRPPGMADLKVIRSVLLKYSRGELAHVENILSGETKRREFNTLKRTEETVVTEEETSSETEKESQTTDRFEVEKEVSSIAKEDMKIDTGVKVTASLGPVSIDTHFNFQYNTSKEESNRTATKNSQELVNRALSRVIEKRRTQRTVATVVQTEDKNLHELTAPSGGPNVHGLYYWIDKYYLSKVVNYGKRLMFEFVVPEPAAFYLYARTKPSAGAKLPPVHPYVFGVTSYNAINDGNYANLASFYGAPDIQPPPPDYTIIATSLKYDKTPAAKEQEDADKQDIAFTLVDTNERLKVPDGYIAHHADVSFVVDASSEQVKTGRVCDNGILGTGFFQNCHDTFATRQTFHILLGNHHLSPDAALSPILNLPLNTEDKVIPVGMAGKARHLVSNIEVVCYRTDRKLREWKNATFNSIFAAYDKKVKEYEDWLRTQDINAGVVIEGNNPEINRRVEKEELKKHCIEMMTGQRFESFDAMRSNVPDFGYPEFSITEAMIEGNYLQFFEQAFEWEQTTYSFYPYFWGRKPFWVNSTKLNDPDPIFESFLRAGAARVLVPARPGFEYDVVTFFASGGKKIWGGKQAPIPGSRHWVSIVDELKEQEGQFSGGAEEGDPWIYKVPTSLVFLDDINAPLRDDTALYPLDVAAASKAKPGQFA